jgi:hypothetical protein
MGRPENVDRNLATTRVQLDDADMAALATFSDRSRCWPAPLFVRGDHDRVLELAHFLRARRHDRVRSLSSCAATTIVCWSSLTFFVRGDTTACRSSLTLVVRGDHDRVPEQA